MKKIKSVSVSLLNFECRDREIICVGCGKRLYEMLDLYKEEPFVRSISALLDNNKKLWGIEKEVGSKIIKIANPVVLESVDNVVLLITSDRYSEIYNSIKAFLNNGIKIYRYPQHYYWWTSLLLKSTRILPLKRQILFYAGSEPHDNADEIVTYLNNDYTGKRYEVVYLGEVDNQTSKQVKCIKSSDIRCKTSFLNVFRYCVLYARSKYLCYENQALEKVDDRQTLIFLNHGTIPLKKVSDVLKQPEDLDIGVCPSEGCSGLYVEQYGIPVEKQIYMMPARVNRMFRVEGKIHSLLKAEGKKVLLWLPTFRQLKGSSRRDSESENPINILEENIYEIDSYLEKAGMVIAVKKHPREKEEYNLASPSKNVFILNDNQMFEDGIFLHDLLKDTDALITDYSGIAFEYMLLDRPIGYVLSDIKEYNRGFAVDNPEEYMPGEKIYDKEQFISFLQKVSKGDDEYMHQRKNLVKKLFGDNAYKNGAETLLRYLNQT